MPSCWYALPQILFLHSGFIHAVVFMVIRSINTAVIKQISKNFHLKSPCKVGLGSNIMYLEGGNKKVWKSPFFKCGHDCLAKYGKHKE